MADTIYTKRWNDKLSANVSKLRLQGIIKWQKSYLHGLHVKMSHFRADKSLHLFSFVYVEIVSLYNSGTEGDFFLTHKFIHY